MRGLANIIAIIFLWFVLVSGTLLVATPLLLLYLLGVFAGAKGRAEGLKTKLRSAMMQGEEVVVEAIEYRPYGLFHRRIGIAVTTSRVIQIRRKILGGFRMRDQQWKDLKDVRIDENSFPEVFGSSLIFEFEPELEARNIEVHGINPKLASAIYGYAQAQEHAWEEKRRVRGLEDKRAMAGGINFHAGQPFGGFAAPDPHPSYGRDRLIEATAMPVGAMDNSSTDPLAKELSRAKSLLDQGAITDAEFQEIKAKILSKYF